MFIDNFSWPLCNTTNLLFAVPSNPSIQGYLYALTICYIRSTKCQLRSFQLHMHVRGQYISINESNKFYVNTVRYTEARLNDCYCVHAVSNIQRITLKVEP